MEPDEYGLFPEEENGANVMPNVEDYIKNSPPTGSFSDLDTMKKYLESLIKPPPATGGTAGASLSGTVGPPLNWFEVLYTDAINKQIAADNARQKVMYNKIVEQVQSRNLRSELYNSAASGGYGATGMQTANSGRLSGSLGAPWYGMPEETLPIYDARKEKKYMPLPKLDWNRVQMHENMSRPQPPAKKEEEFDTFKVNWNNAKEDFQNNKQDLLIDVVTPQMIYLSTGSEQPLQAMIDYNTGKVFEKNPSAYRQVRKVYKYTHANGKASDEDVTKLNGFQGGADLYNAGRIAMYELVDGKSNTVPKAVRDHIITQGGAAGLAIDMKKLYEYKEDTATGKLTWVMEDGVPKPSKPDVVNQIRASFYNVYKDLLKNNPQYFDSAYADIGRYRNLRRQGNAKEALIETMAGTLAARAFYSLLGYSKQIAPRKWEWVKEYAIQ